MYTCPKMQRVIEAIAKKHDIDLTKVESHLRLENQPYQPLVIEVIAPHQVAVGHFYVQNGDLMYDPEIVFFIAGNGVWVPIEITQHPVGVYRQVGFLSEDGEQLRSVDFKRLQSVIELAEMWASNIKGQGFLKVEKQEEQE
jgi:hypothetical protein